MLELRSRPLFHISIEPGAYQEVGDTHVGYRMTVPIRGGFFEGDRLSGTIMDGGSDWIVRRADDVLALNVRITLKTTDGALIALLNHADRVKIGCLAQLVNVIAPIMAEPGGKAWRQPIFFPFADVANLARGVSLRQAMTSATYPSKTLGDVTCLLSSTTYDRDSKRIAVFALNRHLSEAMEFSLDLRGLPDGLELVETRVLAGYPLDATNSAARETVRPSEHGNVALDGPSLRAILAPASWNVFVLSHA